MSRMIYFIEFKRFPGVVKIGCTANLTQRMYALSYQHKSEITVLTTIEGGYRQEHALHHHFAEDGAPEYGTEFFYMTKEIAAFIRDHRLEHGETRYAFRSKVPSLIGKMMIDQRRYINASEVRESIGLPKYNFYLWVKGGYLMSSITESETGAFLNFFNCALDDLVEIVPFAIPAAPSVIELPANGEQEAAA
jgi:hypothetical protein